MKTRMPFILLSAILFLNTVSQEDPYKKEREKMVRYQIENRGLSNKATLTAMRDVPRHLFVPKYLLGNAYDDRPLPIGHGQTISQPYIVAYMTAIIEPEPGDKILEIGTGSGYQAAVLAKITDSVYTIEIIKGLYETAKTRLSEIGYSNIQIKYADGYYGWEEHAPFDAIVVTAAAEHIPPPLINQLRDGGKMIIPVGSPFKVQSLMLVQKKDGKTTTSNLMHVRFVPFTRSK